MFAINPRVLRLLSGIAAALALLLSAMPAQADAISYMCADDWWYHVVDGQCYLDEYVGTAETVTVPAAFLGRKVAQCGGDARDFLNDHVKHVVFAEGIEAINEYYSLRGCKDGLESVSFPGTLREIPRFACASCPKLSVVTLAEGIEAIAASAFQGCASLREIDIPASVTAISDSAFLGCTRLEDIRFAENSSLARISDYAFYNCPALKRIDLPESLRAVCNHAFTESGIRALSLPEGTQSLGFGFPTLDKIYIPDSVTYIGFLSDVRYSIEGTSNNEAGLNTLGDPGSLVVYCNEYSLADQYAYASGYAAVYVDALPFSQYGSLTVEDVEIEEVGGTAVARYSAFPETGAKPLFSSSNRRVFTVSSGGLIIGVGKGTATLGVKIGDYAAHADVTVHAPLKDFALEDIYTVAKEDFQILPASEPADADTDFRYASGNGLLARIGDTGIVQTTGVGSTTITVRDQTTGLTRSCTLYACYPVTAIAFDREAVEVQQHKTAQLNAEVTARTSVYQNKLVAFTSDNEQVAAVDRNGLVTGKAPGTATITATATSGVSASCQVTVSTFDGLSLPADVTEVRDEAFYGDSFKAAFVPEGCLSIGSRAFAGNASLERVYLPDSLEYIAGNAFQGCYSLVVVAPRYSYAAGWAKENGFDVEAE